jgi:hypothetical protein
MGFVIRLPAVILAVTAQAETEDGQLQAHGDGKSI